MPQTNPSGISTLLCSFITYYLRAHLERGISGLLGGLAGGPSRRSRSPGLYFGERRPRRTGLSAGSDPIPQPHSTPRAAGESESPQPRPQLPEVLRPVRPLRGSPRDFIQGLVVKIENGRGGKKAPTTITKKQLATAPESAVWSDPPSLPPAHLPRPSGRIRSD